MKKKSITGIIVVALFIIGIIAALIVYKKVQTMPEKSQIGEEPETVILSADENPFGIEIKKINEDYDLTRNYYKNYDNTGLQKYIIPVIFTDKRTYIAEMREVHDAYISGLGDTYVSSKQLVLSQKELDELSITDCSEIWRLYAWYKTKVIPAKDDAEKEEVRKRIGVIAKSLVQKVLEAPAIYCVYSKITGEPALFSQTVDRQDGTYMCTPPDIWILTKAYKDIFKVRFPEERYEIREIKNDDSHKAIYNFLGYCFYMNGACGVKVVNENTAIAAPEFVPEPDYSNIPEISIPVTNPDLVRWMLLIAQLGQPATEEQKLIYKLYFRFLSIEMTKARFIIPTKTSEDFPEPDENGKTVLKKDMQISLPTIEGKHNNAAVRMYTDWKRLQDAMGDGWKGMVQPIEGIIDQFDCAINLTEHEKAGCYVDKEMFREMQSFEKDFQQNN